MLKHLFQVNSKGGDTVENLVMNIRLLREAHNMTQEELAKLLGVKPPAISKWERGLAYPRMDNVARMAQIFGTTMDVVMGIRPVGA